MSTELPILEPVEQRVLGSLLEKQQTVPASYPLSLNSLRVACNQTSSRDPVSDYDDKTIEDVARSLKARGLLRIVWAGAGSRTLKYHQLLDETLSLQPDERALLCVLLLRGAQSPGELKTRTERMHGFADRAEVEATLQRMAALGAPLVRQLPRRAGQQDHRWIHLLGAAPAEAVALVSTAATRESVLADGPAARDAAVIAYYDQIADDEAERVGEELPLKPFDLWLLDVASAAGDAPIADVGCGPGQIAAFLADSGARVSGFDFSPAMIARARADFPDLDFQVGKLSSLLLPATAPAWGAIIAWHCLTHLAPSELAGAVASLARVLAPGGWLALAMEAGFDLRPIAEGVAVVRHDKDELLAAVLAAGLTEVEWFRRGPYPGESGEQLFVLARSRA
ncbi:MAG: DUF480 domain-containing protein [Micropruina sp.]|nr:DUF480 domain-containing protein [Micropruina sp.]